MRTSIGLTYNFVSNSDLEGVSIRKLAFHRELHDVFARGIAPSLDGDLSVTEAVVVIDRPLNVRGLTSLKIGTRQRVAL